MEIHFTARHFKADSKLKNHAIDSMKKLDKFFDGIRRCDIILSYDRPTNSVKRAELNLHVNGAILTVIESTEDFNKSLELAMDTLERRIETYKSKLRTKDRKKIRRERSKIV